MITNGEIIFQFKQLTDKHHISDDTGWSDSWIFWYLLRSRANIIDQKYRQDKSRISRHNFMTTPCINLIDVPADECPCPPQRDCYVKRTEHALPQLITGVEAVFNNDNSQIYAQTDSSKAKYRKYYSYPSLAKETFFYVRDIGDGTHIYIESEKDLQYIKVEGIPENPLEFQRMKSCNGKVPHPCRSVYDWEWKLDSDLTRIVMDTAIKTLLVSKNTISDIKNNNIDDIIQNKQELIGNSNS